VALFGAPSESFLNLIAHEAPSITIGRLYTAKTIELCNTGDPVCFPDGRDRAAHSAYKDNGRPTRPPISRCTFSLPGSKEMRRWRGTGSQRFEVSASR
jgi:Cutinase